MWTGITPTPDPGFMKKLKVVDPNLDCEFNREVERFIITQPSRLGSGKLVAAIVENPGKDFYRQPDDRDLAVLAKGDFERTSHKQRIIDGEERMRNEYLKKEKDAEDKIREAAIDNKNQLFRAAQYDAGVVGDRHNPAFRRVTPKPKGYKVVDKRKVTK
jgi:hypothetical protein